jgi:hypothetical protein
VNCARRQLNLDGLEPIIRPANNLVEEEDSHKRAMENEDGLGTAFLRAAKVFPAAA